MTIPICARGRLFALLALCVALSVAATACGESAPPDSEAAPEPSATTPEPCATISAPGLPVPTPTPNPNAWFPPYPNVTWSVPPSLEEQVYGAHVIARASLVSVTAGTKTLPSVDACVAPTYRPVQELRFTVHEYLKRSGPSEILVVVRGDHTYITEAEVRSKADYSMSAQNVIWHNREGALFLGSDPTTPGLAGAPGDAEGPPAQTFWFSRDIPPDPAFYYAVNNLSRGWLPAQELGATAQVGGATGQTIDMEFIIDGAKSTTVSLVDLRSAIAEMAATLKAGEGIEGYDTCISSKILRERYRRADPWTPARFEKSLTSGSAAGTEVYRRTNAHREPEYSNYWLSGPDESLFRALIVDDDTDSATGYDHMLATARPLPASVFRVFYNEQHYTNIPCNFVPGDAYRDGTVKVAAPSGMLHEAFFDPVAIGSGVGANDDNGVLEPAQFTASETDVTIDEVSWKSQEVRVELSNDVSLAAHHLDVIGLDGAVTLRLDFDDATSTDGDGGGEVYAWGVCTQPWNDSDLLMLRISESGENLTGATNDSLCDITPTPTPTATATPAPTPGASAPTWMLLDNGAVRPSPRIERLRGFRPSAGHLLRTTHRAHRASQTQPHLKNGTAYRPLWPTSCALRGERGGWFPLVVNQVPFPVRALRQAQGERKTLARSW